MLQFAINMLQRLCSLVVSSGSFTRFVLLLCFTLSVGSICVAQRRSMRVMEYNVENMFDTLHTVGLSDADFTPTGSYQWNSQRYWAKLGRLSRVIAAAGGVQPVDLLALVEIENDSVVSDLIHRTKLWRMGYECVVSHSADVRGINVALVYLPYRFRPFTKDSLRVAPQGKSLRPTRDILHVAGELVTGDTLDVYVCHFPSRRGGKESQNYRECVAQRLRHYVDSVMQMRSQPNVFIMGDFNGYWPESFLADGLGVQLLAATEAVQPNGLYLLTHALKGVADVRGTYKFQGEWNQLDHFVVNGAMLDESRKGHPYVKSSSCQLFSPMFLLKKERNGEGVRPKRTFLGNYYQGGYSDHLPILLDVFFE